MKEKLKDIIAQVVVFSFKATIIGSLLALFVLLAICVKWIGMLILIGGGLAVALAIMALNWALERLENVKNRTNSLETDPSKENKDINP